MKKNKFTQHIPNFMEGFTPKIFEFDTTEELLQTKLFKDVAAQPNFDKFVIKDNHVMEVADDGFYWWVLGYVDHPEQLDLPKWEGWKYRVILDGKETVVKGDEVIWSGGNEIGLKDGRTAKKAPRG